MTDKEFIKNFNLKLPEHIRFIDGYLAAINRLTQRAGYRHLFWIRIFNYSGKSKEVILNEELKITAEELVPLDRFIGNIENAIKVKLHKYFLGGEYTNSPKYVVDAIELLVWDVVEYFDWLQDFTDSCVVEKGTLKLENGNSGEIYCFLLNQEHFVVFGIEEIKIEF